MTSGLTIGEQALIAGHPALDFVNSIEFRNQTGERDHIGGYQAFVNWMARTSLVPTPSARQLCNTGRRRLLKSQGVWRNVERFRDDTWLLFTERAQNRQLSVSRLRRVEELLCEAHQYRRLRAVGGECRWTWIDSDLRYPLWAIVESAVDLLTSERIRGLRICANPPCDWLFLDESRNGLRRWCEMRTCGNLAKVRRYRAGRRHGRIPA